MLNAAVSELSSAQLKNLVSEVLDEALKQGATSAEVDLGINKGFSVTARMGEVESIEYNQDKSLDITVYFDKRTGSASVSDLRAESIHSAVKAACNIARYTDEDPCAGLAEKELLAFNYPELELAFPWDISVEHAIEIACECEAKAFAKDKRITNSENVVVGTGQALGFYGNTLGFIGSYSTTRHDISCVLIAKKGDDMQRDYYYTTASDPALLDSITDVANKAVERTVKRLGARKLSTRKAPVIFIAEEARGLLGHFISAISGSSLYRKSSFLLNSLGTKVFPSHIKLQEHPLLLKGLGSAPFDDNGVATRSNIFVEEGIVKNYVLGTYSARQLGMQTTANAGGVHNLFISTSKNDLSALLKKMGTGLLVTELMGQGINLITGDYSRGAGGYWVENGEIQYPVEEITIASNLRNMYGNLVEVGNDVDKRGNIQTGSILLEEMTIAGE